jgi:prepilin-type N-terminal cleavage/methylation domain-containing protein
MKKMKTHSGMSLIEILIVVGIFAVLGILTTRAVILTVGGGKKSENLIKVRENVNYSLGVIERQLRNADSITDCDNSNTRRIDYLDQRGFATYFACTGIGASTVGYVASGSARLTADAVDITNCSFTCQDGTPRSIKIVLEAQESQAIGAANSVVSASTEVFLRNY